MPVCQELLRPRPRRSISDPQALDLPDAAAAQLLKKAYTDLQECARACAAGQNAEAAFRLALYQGGLSQATAALQPYGMTP